MSVSRILYFYLLLLVALFFVLFDIYLFHLLLIFLLLLPPLSLLAALPVCRALACRLDIDDEIVPKGRCKIRLTEENRSPLPCACVRVRLAYSNVLGHVGERRAESEEELLQFALGARRSLALQPALKAAHCGRLDFSIRRVEVCDLLGIFRLPVPKKRVLAAAGCVYVLPAPQSRSIAVEESSDIGLDSAVYSTEKPGGDPSEIFQLRDYREGDSRHSIHWKLSSRMQHLIVREFGLPLNPSLHFLLELREGARPEAAEDMLGTALAFSEYLMARELVHSLSWPGEEGLLETASVADADALAGALHSLLALPGQRRWSALTHFFAQETPQARTHLVYLIAGAKWDAAEDAPADRMLEGLLESGACSRITIMPDVCPPAAARRLGALGCEVQLLSGRMPGPDAEPEAETDAEEAEA
ncbi:MAG: DUF58 domain-containing protein [Clostridia bacterium]|nr:DUF58 domain-containing protein [Clostridia bacterium]